MELNATINKSVMLKIYNHSNIVQLSRCSVRIRYNDKYVKCSFFLVLGNDPALLRVPNIALLSIIRVIMRQYTTKQMTGIVICKLNMQKAATIAVQKRAHRQSWM